MLAQSQENSGNSDSSGINKSSLYLDVAGGPIFSASVNFEKHIARSASGKFHWFGRVGAGGASMVMDRAGFGGLAAVTILTGNGDHHFEASGGVFLGYDEYDGAFALPHLDLGYRFQKPEGGFLFRAKAGILGAGIGLGYAF